MNLSLEINAIINLLNNRDFKKVISICERLIKKKIKNTQIYNFYGLALQNLGYFNKSIKYFNKSIELEPKNYYAFNNLAVSFKSIEKFKLAEKAYKNCLKLNPNYFFGIINYANFKEEINQLKESIELNLKGLKVNNQLNNLKIFSKLTKLYLSIGETKKAKDYAYKILEKNPNDTEAYNLLSNSIDPNTAFAAISFDNCSKSNISDNCLEFCLKLSKRVIASFKYISCSVFFLLSLN